MSDSTLRIGLEIAIAIVFLGVVLEGAEFVEEYREKGWQADHRLKTVAKLGFALLVLGLGAEGYFSTAIENRDAGRLKEAADRLSIAEIHLTDRQVDRDKLMEGEQDELAGYRGQKLVLRVVENDDEAARFASNLAEALRGALWDVTIRPLVRPPVDASHFNLPITGILGPMVVPIPAKDSKTFGAMGALAATLEAQNFCLGTVNIADWADPDPNTLTLVIGNKDRTSKEGCL